MFGFVIDFFFSAQLFVSENIQLLNHHWRILLKNKNDASVLIDPFKRNLSFPIQKKTITLPLFTETLQAFFGRG